MSGYMGPSYMPCCYNSARFAQNAHCVTGVIRGWIKVPSSYCFRLQLVLPLYAAKAWLQEGERAASWRWTKSHLMGGFKSGVS